MGKHRVAVLSDTHSLLRPEVCRVLSECEAILHAGDIADEETMKEIARYAESYFVRGNCDGSWAKELPKERKVTLFGVSIYMVHDPLDVSISEGEADLILYGHSHEYEEKKVGKTLYFNPGSCGPERYRSAVTMAVMNIDDETGAFFMEKVEIAKEEKDIGKFFMGVAEIAKGDKEIGFKEGRKGGNGWKKTGEIASFWKKLKKGKERGEARSEDKSKGRRAAKSRQIKEGQDENGLEGRDVTVVIKGIIKDMKANRTVVEIAERNHVEVGFVERVLQIYTTHPGIDMDGILNRL